MVEDDHHCHTETIGSGLALPYSAFQLIPSDSHPDPPHNLNIVLSQSTFQLRQLKQSFELPESQAESTVSNSNQAIALTAPTIASLLHPSRISRLIGAATETERQERRQTFAEHLPYLSLLRYCVDTWAVLSCRYYSRTLACSALLQPTRSTDPCSAAQLVQSISTANSSGSSQPLLDNNKAS